ncbi:Cytidine deaminase [bacterium HR12]|nr:Cytidine deaminase [bacterium HR12]
MSRREGPSGEEVERLVAAARSVRPRAYAPYSRFHVGAAVLAEGRIYRGVNVENASYPLSVCAERNAVAAAVAAGRRRIEAVAVVTGEDAPTPPCGGCRQVLHEFGPDVLVVSETLAGRRATWSLTELLPAAFDASSLRGP